MRLAIMQPYFLPYIGYFQLIAAVDTFVVYDNIKYTKKGWINRNRMLKNGTDALFSLPLKHGSDALDVCDRELAVDFNRDRLLDQLSSAYRRAPHFQETFAVVERVIRHHETNLFRFVYHSIVVVCQHLGIATELRISSGIDIDHGLKAQDKVLALCQALGAETYVNAIGGTDLYAHSDFAARGIELRFLKSRPIEYHQFGSAFVPWLSIVDVLMFNSREETLAHVTGSYDLIDGQRCGQAVDHGQ